MNKVFLVILAAGIHPVTSRTRKLSPPALMVLGGQPPGRVGHCQEDFFLLNTNHGLFSIYKAHQPSMDRYVALKILPRQFANDPQFVGRFEQEAKVIARLHPISG